MTLFSQVKDPQAVILGFTNWLSPISKGYTTMNHWTVFTITFKKKPHIFKLSNYMLILIKLPYTIILKIKLQLHIV